MPWLSNIAFSAAFQQDECMSMRKFPGLGRQWREGAWPLKAVLDGCRVTPAALLILMSADADLALGEALMLTM
jgi:hypothetical protein